MTIPGIGPIAATAIIALAPPLETFHKGRDFAAWLGLAPRQHSTGGKQRLGSISKMGERTIRRLLIIGGSSMVRQACRHCAPAGSWLERMLARKPRMLVSVALANKMAAWSGRCSPRRRITGLRQRSRRKLGRRSEASGT
jgi:transposase